MVKKLEKYGDNYMNISLERANIVVLAKNHNPSIVSKEWIKQKKIFVEEIKDFVHTPVFSVLNTENFNLIIDSERLQLTVKKDIQNNLQYLPKIISTYISNLPETPYTAIGLNYLYNVISTKVNLDSIFPTDSKKFEGIFSKDYKIGGEIRFKFKGFTGKLGLYPLEYHINASFNFQFNSKNVNDITNQLDIYFDVIKYAEHVLKELFNV